MKPFDLEAAKRGEPIQTRDGQPAKFIAHVPEANEPYQVVVMVNSSVQTRHENGRLFKDSDLDNFKDLFMSPRKRTVWVNLYKNSQGRYASHVYSQKEFADENGGSERIGNRAWPLEIEE